MREHEFDITLIEYVATLAHVVHVREHKFYVTLIEYVATHSCFACKENHFLHFELAHTVQNDTL